MRNSMGRGVIEDRNSKTENLTSDQRASKNTWQVLPRNIRILEFTTLSFKWIQEIWLKKAECFNCVVVVFMLFDKVNLLISRILTET